MLGFYDPASLNFKTDHAVINFIALNAADEVTPVEIRDADHAGRVSRALEDQKTHGITALEGRMVRFRGSIAFNPKAPDEALLTPDDADSFGRTVPVKLGFGVDATSLPRFGYAMGDAAEVDGALIVSSLAVCSLVAAHDRRPAPSSHGPSA